MQQRGYWRAAGVARPHRASVRMQRHFEAEAMTEPQPVGLTDDGGRQFSGADLSDLRMLVEQLPARLRLAIVLRYWQDATEVEISRALGGVTTRTVRNYLRQGYTLLRGWYGECEVGTI
jgi:DNA-directed RNA polymerase specialized sigma24 family protein